MSLNYPIKATPDSQDQLVIDINSEIKWVRMPLPMSLDHINCYLIKDGEGWCIVDTGMPDQGADKQWQTIIEQELEGAPISKVLVTHQHPDHVGMAGWLCRTFKAPLYMSQSEYMIVRAFSLPPSNPAEPYWHTMRFFLRAGMDPKILDAMRAEREKSQPQKENPFPLPASYVRIRGGEELTIGEYKWQLIATGGHAPEHISLYCADLDIYISGDQVLPVITSNVSVMPTEPEANPLEDWFEGLIRIKDSLPDSPLVLPSHQQPFTGLHERIDELLAHHEERMETLVNACTDSPKNILELTNILFDRDLESFQFFIAMGECIAHLHCLHERGQINREVIDEKYLYSTA